MLACDEAVLRAFLARIRGYEHMQAVEHALCSIDQVVTRRATLVLLGVTDMVPIALALHRRTLGADRPFIVNDPRRANVPATTRAARLGLSHVALTQWLDRRRRWRWRARWGGQ